MSRYIAMITLLCLALPPVAAAGDDCPADADRAAAARNEFENGRRYEAAGEAPSALMTYLLARDYDCEDRNGIGGAAARRVVPLARQLGREQEVEGNLLMAYSIYDSGGLFAEADRALMQLASDVEGGVGFQSQAREHFQQRLEPGFAAANRLKLQAAGPYTASREPLERLAALPPRAVETLLEREAQWLDDDYLEAFAGIALQRELNKPVQPLLDELNRRAPPRFREDRLDDSQTLLQLAQGWCEQVADPQQRQALAARIRRRVLERGDQIVSRHARAPAMFMQAEVYYNLAQAPARVEAMKSQVRQQGDRARDEGNPGLAMAFYLMADDSESVERLLQQTVEASDATR